MTKTDRIVDILLKYAHSLDRSQQEQIHPASNEELGESLALSDQEQDELNAWVDESPENRPVLENYIESGEYRKMTYLMFSLPTEGADRKFKAMMAKKYPKARHMKLRQADIISQRPHTRKIPIMRWSSKYRRLVP